ncbi:MAG TPA: NUDIX hydrolase [Patescibacteria group bacterium]|nr:NUDIX hydrolase [Patescibacteria group bacterium]
MIQKLLRYVYPNQVSAGGIVYRTVPRLQVLLIKNRWRTYWGFPKGHLEKGETPVQAAQREVKEETGVTTRIVQNLGEDTYIYKELFLFPIKKTVYYFFMESLSQENVSPLEIEEARWLEPQAAFDLLTFENSKKLLRNALDSLAHQV